MSRLNEEKLARLSLREVKQSGGRTTESGVSINAPRYSPNAAQPGRDVFGHTTADISSVEGKRQRLREWKNSVPLRSNVGGRILTPSSGRSRDIMNGFRINSMLMRDADTGSVLWRTTHPWGPETFNRETSAHIPAKILQCRAVTREIAFHSTEPINDFKLQQRIYLNGQCIEEWAFDFGFVIPGSTNTWSQTIQAADKSQMIPAHILSGNVIIETRFMDGDVVVSQTLVRLFYI